MNERLEQLAVQAKELAEQAFREDGVKRFTTMEKFAELIVKEAGAYLMQPEFIGRSDLDWSMVLNEHFGVEE